MTNTAQAVNNVMQKPRSRYIIKDNGKGWYVGYQDDARTIRMVSPAFKSRKDAVDYKVKLEELSQMSSKENEVRSIEDKRQAKEEQKSLRKTESQRISCHNDFPLAVLAFLESQDNAWVGTISELRECLLSLKDVTDVPSNYNVMGRALKQNEDSLKEIGINIERRLYRKGAQKPYRAVVLYTSQGASKKDRLLEELKSKFSTVTIQEPAKTSDIAPAPDKPIEDSKNIAVTPGVAGEKFPLADKSKVDDSALITFSISTAVVKALFCMLQGEEPKENIVIKVQTS